MSDFHLTGFFNSYVSLNVCCLQTISIVLASVRYVYVTSRYKRKETKELIHGFRYLCLLYFN